MRRRWCAYVAALLLAVLPLRAWALAMQISNLSDFTLPSWSIGDPAIQATMDICIYGLNIPSLTSYAIQVSSSPAGYKVSTGGQTIPYALYWNDGGGGQLSNSGTQLSDGSKLTLRQNLNILFADCSLSGPTARLILKITQADMTAALSGNYTGTITLLLTPN